MDFNGETSHNLKLGLGRGNKSLEADIMPLVHSFRQRQLITRFSLACHLKSESVGTFPINDIFVDVAI